MATKKQKIPRSPLAESELCARCKTIVNLLRDETINQAERLSLAFDLADQLYSPQPGEQAEVFAAEAEELLRQKSEEFKRANHPASQPSQPPSEPDNGDMSACGPAYHDDR